jgi:large subunit ribosomal protein L10
MNRTQKSAVVERLTKQLSSSATIYVTDFTGIAVKPMTELRDKLRDAGVAYVVVKNTLALRAMEEAAVSGLEGVLTGPTGFVFAGDDPVAPAKVLADFGREHGRLAVKAGVVEGRRVSTEDVTWLATLPSRDQLLAQAAGYLEAPLQGFVGVLNGMFIQMVGALEALRTQRASA